MQAAARSTLERIAKGLDGVRELRAEYTQEQHSLLLDEPLVSSGHLHLRAEPGCIVLEVEKPRPALIRSDSKSHLVYHPTTKRAERFLFESNELTKALLACFTADLARIEGLFSITAYSEDPATKRATLSLQPERDEIRAAVRSLTLEIDLATGLPTRIIQVNPEGEELRLSLRNTVRNPERRPGDIAIFDRPLPKDVVVSERSVPSTGSHER
ncbi:MAG TPA: outer membrane lipoprotein carrier protein LolA [Planctomycetota bacterium]|nr:outer membrane lipoprotein carrier protein LolA [Planctomycetota bacterium]